MAGKLWLVGGLAAGYVLGTRAGRQRYDQLTEAARKVKNDPTVQNALEVVQDQAAKIYAGGRAVVTEKLGSSRAERAEAELDAEMAGATVPARA